jgi:hypothetical protein
MSRRPIVYALLLCYLAACTTWHVEDGASPLLLIATEHPSRVRLTRSDSSLIVLENPRIAGSDTLVGQGHKESTTVAVSDVRQIATQHVSAGKTIGLVFGLSVVAAFVIAVESLCSNGYCSQ